MRISGLFFVTVTVVTLFAGLTPRAQAVEEGQLVKKEGKWEYYSGEDPGLKYLFLKGIITQEDYDKGLKVIETKERISKPNFNIDVNNGLNIRVGEKFFLKLRLLTQVRYSHSSYNSLWGSVGDSRNPEILGGQVEYRAIRKQSDSNQFIIPRARLQFLGYAFDPDFRYNFSLALDQTPWNQEGGGQRKSRTPRRIRVFVAHSLGNGPGRPTASLVQSRQYQLDRHVDVCGQYDRPERLFRQPSQQSRHRDQHFER